MELKDWLPNALTGLTLIVTVLIAVASVKASLRQVLEEKKHEIRVALFEKLIGRVVEASAAVSAACSMVDICAEVFERSLTNPDIYPRRKPSDFNEAQQHASQQVTELIFSIESHEIVVPKSKVFVQKFSELGEKMGLAFSMFLSSVLQHLQVRVADGDGRQGDPLCPPNKEQVDSIKDRAKAYVAICRDISMYLKDVMTETQNLLLGPIFGGKVEPRKPLDPTYAPLKLEQS